ncbi:MAG: cyclic nucleotide-binding domain-containing protein [Gammaproteobacteria bacterium]|nr:cyclic nucleotide-binding domain-containing protein [Gammaproteobacteria bacterium]
MTMSMDAAQLSTFSPFNTLESANLSDLLDSIDILHATPGQILFEKGDTEKRSIYVLSGTLSLRNGDQDLGTIVGGTDEARNPVARALPRQLSAVAADDVQYFSIDSELVDMTLTLDHTGIYEVGDIGSELLGGEGDWMAALLQTKTFQLIPPQNIQMIFMRLKRVDFKAGDVVIRQGTNGDHFYIITSGRCMVTRETPGDSANIDLAELGPGGTFGEEALISDETRNATITMMTDGILMKLDRDDFQSLLNEPMIISLEHEDADEAVTQGGKWLDVRVPSEFKAFSKSNAMNLPLYLLRHKLDALDRKTPYVVYCDTGRRSSAAAFILNQKGFETAVLKGGLNHTEL